MSGNKADGLKAAATNKRKYGQDFYRKVGGIGGKASNNGGFASEKVGPDGLTGLERASRVGVIGGKKSPAKALEYEEVESSITKRRLRPSNSNLAVVNHDPSFSRLRKVFGTRLVKSK